MFSSISRRLPTTATCRVSMHAIHTSKIQSQTCAHNAPWDHHHLTQHNDHQIAEAQEAGRRDTFVAETRRPRLRMDGRDMAVLVADGLAQLLDGGRVGGRPRVFVGGFSSCRSEDWLLRASRSTQGRVDAAVAAVGRRREAGHRCRVHDDSPISVGNGSRGRTQAATARIIELEKGGREWDVSKHWSLGDQKTKKAPQRRSCAC